MDTAFQIEEEVDKLFERFHSELVTKSEQLKERLKRAINKDEKFILKQYIASQKGTTTKFQKESSQKKTMSPPSNEGRRMGQKMPVGSGGVFRGRSSAHRAQTYEHDSSSDSD